MRDKITPDSSQPDAEAPRKGRPLLVAAKLAAGGLLTIASAGAALSGCANTVASNPKGSWYDDAGYEADTATLPGDATETGG